MSTEKLRLDKYLWAIRLFKTRTQATAACDEGKVKMNGNAVKPARTVGIGDRYDVKTPDRKWTIEVSALLHTRQAYEIARQHYVDLTSEEDMQQNKKIATSFYTGKRLSKTGKPTKKQRRDLSDFMGGEDDI